MLNLNFLKKFLPPTTKKNAADSVSANPASRSEASYPSRQLDHPPLQEAVPPESVQNTMMRTEKFFDFTVDDGNDHESKLEEVDFEEEQEADDGEDGVEEEDIEVGNALSGTPKDADSTLKIGSTYETLDIARKAAVEFAGIPLVKSSSEKGKYVLLKCICSGKPRFRVSDEERQRERESLKCECEFEIRLSRIAKSSSYKVYKISPKHKHDLPEEDDKVFLSKMRYLPKEVEGKCIELYQMGLLKTKQIIHLIEKEFFPDLKKTWTQKDIQNVLQKCGNRSLEAHDFMIALNRMRDEHGWKVIMEHDPQSLRLKRVFWMSRQAIEFGQLYRDVWEGDATYKSNRFGMPLVLFTGCDNNGITFLLCGALLCDESAESYNWVLNCLNSSIGVHPSVMFTDGDVNFIAAIDNVFPQTTHLLCRWHISRNILKNLASTLGSETNHFINELWRVSSYESEREFEQGWLQLQSKFRKDKILAYMNLLYSKKEKWVFAYTHRSFVAGISSTQREESINFQIKDDLVQNSTLTNLLNSFNKLETSIMEKVRKARFQAKAFTSRCNDPLIKEALGELTPYAGKLLKEESAVVNLYMVQGVNSTDTAFKVYHRENPGRCREVSLCRSDEGQMVSMSCSCRKQVWHGIVCRHILAVLQRINALTCPTTWFNRRWFRDEKQTEFRKNAALHVMVSSFSGASSASTYSDQDLLQSRKTFAELSDDFKFLLERALNDTKARDIVKAGVASLKLSVEVVREASDSPLATGGSVLVQNPSKVKTKGAPKTATKRLKPTFEKNVEQRKKKVGAAEKKQKRK
jgi:zinc finger SWIM domain-containing protein 3